MISFSRAQLSGSENNENFIRHPSCKVEKGNINVLSRNLEILPILSRVRN